MAGRSATADPSWKGRCPTARTPGQTASSAREQDPTAGGGGIVGGPRNRWFAKRYAERRVLERYPVTDGWRCSHLQCVAIPAGSYRSPSARRNASRRRRPSQVHEDAFVPTARVDGSGGEGRCLARKTRRDVAGEDGARSRLGGIAAVNVARPDHHRALVGRWPSPTDRAPRGGWIRRAYRCGSRRTTAARRRFGSKRARRATGGAWPQLASG